MKPPQGRARLTPNTWDCGQGKWDCGQGKWDCGPGEGKPSPSPAPFTENPPFSSSESLSSSKRSLNSFLSSSFLSSCFLRLISGKFRSSSWKENKSNSQSSPGLCFSMSRAGFETGTWLCSACPEQIGEGVPGVTETHSELCSALISPNQPLQLMEHPLLAPQGDEDAGNALEAACGSCAVRAMQARLCWAPLQQQLPGFGCRFQDLGC